jgi:protein-S-isoprenylcysteine O-methyltransferase Ste14
MIEQPEQLSDTAPRLTRSGRRLLVGTACAPLLEATLLLLSAGLTNLTRVWLFLLLFSVGVFGQIGLVALVNPDLVNRRGAWRTRTDTKRWDKTLIIAYGLLAFYAVPIVTGLDLGQHGGPILGVWSLVIGTVLFVLGTVVITWAMLVNTHFETTVRIQHDREHKVITTGPYAVVRHPGYVGASLWALATPLIVGSAFGLIPALLAVLTVAIRTRREDALLHHELSGYADYASRVHYRLLPGIW